LHTALRNGFGFKLWGLRNHGNRSTGFMFKTSNYGKESGSFGLKLWLVA